LHGFLHAIANEAQFALDTEFVRENTFYPKLALIQVATERQTALIDPLALSRAQLAPLVDLLKNPRVLKIMHAAHGDQECFFHSLGVIASPVLDTAVAAALCGMGDNVGLAQLLKNLLGIRLPKGRSRAHWLSRPLSEELLDYARGDVAHLVALGKALIAELEKRKRLDWALEESGHEASHFEESPEGFAEKLCSRSDLNPASRGALQELVRWRENRVREANLPRAWVADNAVLVALARTCPKSTAELRTFRGLNRREIDKSGDAILAAIRTGRSRIVPSPTRSAFIPPSEQEQSTLAVVRAFLSYLADKHGVAVRFLVDSDALLKLLRSSQRMSEEWVGGGVMSPHAAKLIGSELGRFFSGELLLGIRNQRFVVIENRKEIVSLQAQ
jgi:ribonuclease D